MPNRRGPRLYGSRGGGVGAVGIRWQGLRRSKEAACVATACHVERSEAQSRHLAANMACLPCAARFLHCGLRPPVGMTTAQGRLESATVCRPHPAAYLGPFALDGVGARWYYGALGRSSIRPQLRRQELEMRKGSFRPAILSIGRVVMPWSGLEVIATDRSDFLRECSFSYSGPIVPKRATMDHRKRQTRQKAGGRAGAWPTSDRRTIPLGSSGGRHRKERCYREIRDV